MAILSEIDLLLVIGSRTSSNSNRLVEVARSNDVPAYLFDDESEIDEAWLSGIESVGVTAGASAPESLVSRVVSWFGERGVEEFATQHADPETVTFRAPAELRSSGVS
jgi:4-hydroxy-3-methylbut-2-en-1-yl diphosphate reductase